MFEEVKPPAKEDIKKEEKKKPKGRFDITFDSKPTPYFSASSQASDFPSIDEAKKIKKGPSPKKEEKKFPAKVPEKEDAPSEPMEMPRFTNTKKKDDKPVFSKLESVPQDHTPSTELISEPYSDKGPREFNVHFH